MIDFNKIDKNFFEITSVDMSGRVMYNVCEKPFRVYGLLLPQDENDIFRRMPLEKAQEINKGVELLHDNTAGGRVRFATDSARVSILVKVRDCVAGAKFSLSGRAGLDLYEITPDGEKYLKHFPPSEDGSGVFAGEHIFKEKKMRNFTLYMPSYTAVLELYVALDEGALLKECVNYTYEKPIVYYGSSITQGANASRPGTTYQNILSRRFDTDYINLGFSGNALGEPAMARYIAGLDMSICVLDYDHNAPNAEHLRNTHYKMYEIIREAQPDLPIIFMSKPNYHTATVKFDVSDNEKHRQIIIESYERARANGDTNVYFVDGKQVAEVFGAGDNMTVDGCHPNDIGFLSMAKLLGDRIEKILNFNTTKG